MTGHPVPGASCFDELAEALDSAGLSVCRSYPLGPSCTYRVGGAAEIFVEVTSDVQLGTLARVVVAAGASVPVLVVGRGSNLLVADGGFAGLAVRLGDAFAEVRIDEDGRVVAGAASSLPVVARRTAAAGLTGFEWAVGVPGSVGGAVRMNAGGHGADLAASLVSVRVISMASGEDVEMRADDLRLGYRTSALTPDDVVVSATLQLAAGDQRVSEAEISEIVAWRREHQPGGANAGSVFTNPPGDSAGRLIDAAGGRGLRIGSAQVSTKHANFIQSDPGGSADDVAAVMSSVQSLVAEKFDIALHPETVLIGEFTRGAPQ